MRIDAPSLVTRPALVPDESFTQQAPSHERSFASQPQSASKSLLSVVELRAPPDHVFVVVEQGLGCQQAL